MFASLSAFLFGSPPKRCRRKIVLVGKTCAGKTFAANALKREGVSIAVSQTTRPRRPHEVDKKDYHFLTEEEFDNSDMYECVEFNGFRYGMSLATFMDSDVFVLTPGGVANIVKNGDRSSVWVVYLDPESREYRMNQRDYSEDARSARNTADENEFAEFTDFDQKITDDECDINKMLQSVWGVPHDI
jgi:guanylate kinase